MKTRRGYLPTEQHFPLTGMNTLVPSTMLSPGDSPKCRNVMVTKGILSKRKGYEDLGSELDGTIMGLVEFESAAGSKFLVALTTTKQYYYDTSSGAWVNITYQESETDVDWTGDTEDLVDWVDAPGTEGKWLIITNGKDTPRYWDGTGTFDLITNASGWAFTNFVTCKTLCMFYDHLVFGNVTTTSQEKQTIAWTDTASLVDFEGENSGAMQLTDLDGEIVKLLRLGDRLAVYTENSIGIVSYIGGEILYSFETLVRETRLVSARTIIDVGPYHLFLSQENVYLFENSRMIRPVGNAIQKDYREQVFLGLRHRSFAFHDKPKHQIYWVIPDGVDSALVYLQEYDIFDATQHSWVPIAYRHRPNAMGYFSRDATLRWNSDSIAALSWAELDITWRQGSVKSDFPTRVFGSDAQVYLNDDSLATDAGSEISSFWDSKDFTIPQVYQSENARWLEIELEAYGFEVDVWTSIDEGQTYQFHQKINLTSKFARHRIPIDRYSRSLRIHLVNDCLNSSFYLRWLRVWFTPGGAH